MQIKFLSILKSAHEIRKENPDLALVKYEAVIEGVWRELTDEQRWVIIELLKAQIEGRFK